jgi:hypothetical protein
MIFNDLNPMTQVLNKQIIEPVTDRRLLNPIDRISETLFGLIMALTFTCTISVIDADRAEVRGMLIGALGCNIAWGLVDAVMFLVMTLTEKGRSSVVFRFVRKTNDRNKSVQFISDSIPPIIASVITGTEMESLRKRIIELPEPKIIKLALKDYKIAFGIFLLVFLSTLPIAIPFVFFRDVTSALRISNLVAIVMMFICGVMLAKYSGRKRLVMGLMMSLIGVVLVSVTIALGG